MDCNGVTIICWNLSKQMKLWQGRKSSKGKLRPSSSPSNSRPAGAMPRLFGSCLNLTCLVLIILHEDDYNSFLTDISPLVFPSLSYNLLAKPLKYRSDDVIPSLKLFNGSPWSWGWSANVFVVAESLLGLVPASLSGYYTLTPWFSCPRCLHYPLKDVCVCVCVYVHSTYLILFFLLLFFLYACSDFPIELEWLSCLRLRNCVVTWFLKDWLGWLNEWMKR